MQNNRMIGNQYEKIAGKFLESQGYQILCYNFRCHMGEIDIIAKCEEELVFVEVKYRKNLSMGSPLEAVGVSKQKVISKCARYYMVTHYKYEVSSRFDVIGITGAGENKSNINHIKNAFENI